MLKDIKPNYVDLGFSDCMGPQLKLIVEKQLRDDLKNYNIDDAEGLKFDWSETCIEGHRTEYLDGSVENFSGIALFDKQDHHVANGWMEFIREENFFIAYWEFVTTWDKRKKTKREKNYWGSLSYLAIDSF